MDDWKKVMQICQSEARFSLLTASQMNVYVCQRLKNNHSTQLADPLFLYIVIYYK